MTDVLRVQSRAASFRRVGLQFTQTPTDIPLTALTDTQRAAIEAEPALVSYIVKSDADAVTAVAPDDAAPAKAAGKQK
jgi:hypothetical protein